MILIGDMLLANQQVCGVLLLLLLETIVIGGEEGGRFVGLREVLVDLVGAEDGSCDS